MSIIVFFAQVSEGSQRVGSISRGAPLLFCTHTLGGPPTTSSPLQDDRIFRAPDDSWRCLPAAGARCAVNNLVFLRVDPCEGSTWSAQLVLG